MSLLEIGNITASNLGGAQNTTFAHNNDKTVNSALLLFLNAEFTGGGAPTVTYNGVGMTVITSIAESADKAFAYYLLNPASGSNTVAITSGSFDNMYGAVAISLGEVDTAGLVAFSSTDKEINTGNDITLVNSGAADDTAFSFVGGNQISGDPSTGSLTSPSGATETINQIVATNKSAIGYYKEGSENHVYSVSSGRRLGVMVGITPRAPEPPVLDGVVINNLFSMTLGVSSNLTDEGIDAVTERGFVYSTSANPTTADTKSVVAGTTGAYSATLTGLTPATTYYIRAYGTNSDGTGYGTEESFTTDENTSSPIIILDNPVTF